MEQGLKGFPHRQPKATGGGLPPDGNYVDIVVSAGGAVWTISVPYVESVNGASGVVTGIQFVDCGISATGTDTYAGTAAPVPSAYSDGQAFLVKFANTNTGASTLNLNTLGPISIVKPNGAALIAGDIVANTYYWLCYDGTNFQLITRSPLTGEVTAVGGNGATVLDKTAITNKATVTPTLLDSMLIGDQSDSDNLKKITVQDLSTLINPDGLTQGKMVAAIGGWAHQ